MTDKPIEEKVKDIIVEQLGVNPEQVTPTASFIEDLGADSLDIVELVMAFEEEFSVEVPDEDAEKLQTVGDVVKYIEEKARSNKRYAVRAPIRQRSALIPRKTRLRPCFFVSGCRAGSSGQTEPMNFVLLERPLFYVAGHYVSFLGCWPSPGFSPSASAGPVPAERLRPAFPGALQARHQFHRHRHHDPERGGARFLHRQRHQRRRHSSAWTAPLPGLKLSLVQHLPADRAAHRGLLVFLAHEAISSSTASWSTAGSTAPLQYAIAQIVSNLVLVIGIFIVLENTGIHLGALTVFAGAVGVGIGFGLQNIASNFISGLVILAERPIAIGDRVEVAGIAGQVQQIRARSTVIVTNDNIAMIVPNSKFIDSPVTNWTYGDPRVRFRIPVGVAYGSDVDQVREALIAAGQERPPRVAKTPRRTFFSSNSAKARSTSSWSSGAPK